MLDRRAEGFGRSSRDPSVWTQEQRVREAYRRERDALAAQPCQCVTCADCRGSGHVWYQTGRYPEEEMEGCDACSGSGITEQCDRCADLMELEEAYAIER
jgi:DnaJ-class molecular chaperone